MTKRQKVEKYITSLDYVFCGSIPDVISILQKYNELYPNAQVRYKIDPYDNEYSLQLVNVCDETDEEMTNRLNQEKERENLMRKQYEALKKKFDPTI